MIQRFKSLPLSTAGYPTLRKHEAETREGGLVAVYKECDYLWGKCEWCGNTAILDDEGEEDPFTAFKEKLGWLRRYGQHFCCAKCRAAHPEV